MSYIFLQLSLLRADLVYIKVAPSYADQLKTPQSLSGEYKKERQEAIFPIFISPLILTPLCTQAAEYFNSAVNGMQFTITLPPSVPLLSHCFPQNSLTHYDRTGVHSLKWHLMHSAWIMCTVACCISIPLLSTSPSQEAIMVIQHLREERRKEGRSCQRVWREGERWKRGRRRLTQIREGLMGTHRGKWCAKTRTCDVLMWFVGS